MRRRGATGAGSTTRTPARGTRRSRASRRGGASTPPRERAANKRKGYREKMTAKLDAEFSRYADGLASIRYAKTFIEFRAHFDEHGEFSGSIFEPEGMSFGWYQSMPAWERYGIEMGDLK